MEHKRQLELCYSLVVNAQKLVRESLVEDNFPIFRVDAEHFVEYFDGSLMPTQQVERAPKLLEVLSA